MKNSYETIEEAYKALKPELVRYAKKKLNQKEDAEDVVGDAFICAIKYTQGKKDARISKFVLYKEVQKESYKRNKLNRELSIETLQETGNGFIESESVDSWYNDGSFGSGSD